MITLSVQEIKTKKTQIKSFTSLDLAKKEGLKVVTSKKLKLAGASYDTEEERSIVEMLYKYQEGQEGHPRD